VQHDEDTILVFFVYARFWRDDIDIDASYLARFNINGINRFLFVQCRQQVFIEQEAVFFDVRGDRILMIKELRINGLCLG
jgi:hypothetical protein